MSKASPLVNGENITSGGDFEDATVNMVAISDSRSGKSQDLKDFTSNQDKCAKLYSCDFDHMYASVNDNTSSSNQDKDREIKHLKDLLLLHLDLIQQQSEQIVTKDKQLASLRQDYETLKLRFQRMERRVTLQKHRDTDETEPTPTTPVSTTTATPTTTTTTGVMSPTTTTTTNTVVNVCDNETVSNKTCLTIPVVNRKQNLESTNEYRKGFKRSRFGNEMGVKRRASTGSGSLNVSSNVVRKKRTTSMGSDKNKSLSENEYFNEECKKELSNCDESDKKMKERLRMKTETEYYTIVGEEKCRWTISEPVDPVDSKCQVEHVQVPSWREKPLTPCYVMEGTENLGDEVFNKRHQRLEVDERRRKRWDIQRIREQHQIDKLKQREYKSSQSNMCQDRPLTSFYPSIEDLQEIIIQDNIPVCAFGMEVPLFEQCEFSLTWNINRQQKYTTVKRKTAATTS